MGGGGGGGAIDNYVPRISRAARSPLRPCRSRARLKALEGVGF